MSKTDSLHYQLCLEGAKWLHRKKKTQYGAGRLMNGCLWAFKYVAVEINTVAAENPDVWGYDGCYSAVIEVKTSHSDFLSDKKKWCRSKEAEESGLQAGTFRWYLCPEGGIVLDPFMGSGTTGIVANKLGRHYVGIELNPQYVEMAKRRIGLEESQIKLF